MYLRYAVNIRVYCLNHTYNYEINMIGIMLDDYVLRAVFSQVSSYGIKRKRGRYTQFVLIRQYPPGFGVYLNTDMERSTDPNYYYISMNVRDTNMNIGRYLERH